MLPGGLDQRGLFLVLLSPNRDTHGAFVLNNQEAAVAGYRFLLLLSASCLLCAATLLVLTAFWPERSSSQAAPQTGKNIYQRCIPCHGSEGNGDGPAALMLSPRPRDFTTGVYKYRSTESGSIPTDEDITRSIRNGLPGTAMPGWDRFITGDSLSALVGYLKRFSPKFGQQTPQPVTVGLPLPASPASIAAGQRVYEQLQCASCHGNDGRGGGQEFQDANGLPLLAADLTAPWTFGGGNTSRDVYLRFRTGMDGTPMPSYVGAASERDMWDLANYVLSLARRPLWEADQQGVARYFAHVDSMASGDLTRWGRYQVASHGCADCHTPLDGKGGYVDSLKMAGGQKWKVGPWGYFVTYNLTSDKETGLGSWTDDQIKRFLTTGIRPDGSKMLPFPMPWTAYAGMTERALNSIVAYLRTLAPVRNAIPKPEGLGFFSYMGAKFRLLIQREKLIANIYAGNAGSYTATPADTSARAASNSSEVAP